ncbi:hypothetical protein BX661DRAFT_182096 [Kickxella alabastrina]|uniref:uncharacterized protein n=1 Tax=Kickxella alabastrina TaxID=61397 RepID=UPI00221F9BBD|nr:uncharacterized protein BX661DRAFT_182096 [Kickxella alabastrina]KAI7828442.1 hypothetical protein BX661DRAFT_182096 [Kickxella alabastrina]
MTNCTAKFEAMMANVTAPPLSLDEFRMYVDYDQKARDALAFCEWYQRYRTVYFDRVVLPSTRYTTATSTRSVIPREPSAPECKQQLRLSRAAAGRTSRRSMSVPIMRAPESILSAMINVHSSKPHNFSILSESIVDCAFNTATTGASGGSGSDRSPFACTSMFSVRAYPSLANHYSDSNDSGGYCEGTFADTAAHNARLRRTIGAAGLRPIARRRTLSVTIGELGLEQHTTNEQENNRRQIQSLLIFECWSRFLCDHAQERLDIPDSELMYIKERLPLNITHIPRPLLCQNDMLAPPSPQVQKCSGTIANCSSAASGGPKSLENMFDKHHRPAHLCIPSQRSMHFQPCDQLKRNMASLVQLQQPSILNIPRVQSPLSLGSGVNNISDVCLNLEGSTNKSSNGEVANTSAKYMIASLRRISTMPSLKHTPISSVDTRGAKQEFFGCQLRLPLSPQPLRTKKKRTVSIGALQELHHSLWPQPPFSYTPADFESNCALQYCGYKPVPKSIFNLIVPSAVPPALFDTIAKLSAEYLFSGHFVEFCRHARYNITHREQRGAAAGSAALFTLGFAIGAVLVVVDVHIALRVLAMPFLLAATLLTMASLTRVNIVLWWLRLRSTSLIRYSNISSEPTADGERHLQTRFQTDPVLCAIQTITGTIRSPPFLALAGTIYNTDKCMHGSRCCYCLLADNTGKEDANAAHSSARLDTVSPFSMWSQLTLGTATSDLCGKIVRFMLRKCNTGDQWYVDLRTQRYEIFEPHVLRGQCHIVMHQLSIALVVWVVTMTALFLIP